MAKGPLSQSWLNAVINLLMLAVTAYIIFFMYSVFVTDIHTLRNYGLSEFTINYEGGFVRRGLLGQLILWIASTTGISPRVMIGVLSLLSFAFVVYYMVRNFISHGICWWILPTSYVFVSAIICIVRKDFFIISIFILTLWLYRHTQWNKWVRLAILATSVALCTLIYEGISFIIIPATAILLLSDRQIQAPLWAKLCAIAVPCIAFVACSIAHGDAATAEAIHQSWRQWDGEMININELSLSLWAISWDIPFALQCNESILLYDAYTSYWPKVIYRIAVLLLTLYIGSRYLFTMTRQKADDDNAQSQFSTLFFVIFLCMSPLWLGLSCDFGRMVMQLMIISFATWWSMPPDQRKNLFPQPINNAVVKLNHTVDTVIPNRPATIAVLLLCTGISSTFFFLSNLWNFSAIGILVQMLRTWNITVY